MRESLAQQLPRPGMTDGGLTLLLVLGGTLVFCSALFSGLETALFALKAHQLRSLEEHHPSLKHFIHVFRDNPRRVLNVLLLGDALVNVPLVILSLFLLWETRLGTHVPLWAAATVIFALLVLVCDLIPKLLAISAPYRLSAIGVFTLRAMMPLLDRVGQRAGEHERGARQSFHAEAAAARCRDAPARNSRRWSRSERRKARSPKRRAR